MGTGARTWRRPGTTVARSRSTCIARKAMRSSCGSPSAARGAGCRPTRSPAPARWVTGDFDGAGNGDLALVWNANGTIYMDAHLSNRNQAVRDVLTRVTNPLGGQISITHQPATHVEDAVRPDIADCGGASGPITGAICGNPNPTPVPLVTRIETSDGRGHTYSKHYDYYNARYLPGVPSESEHLGFRRITVVDEQLNQKNITWHRQDKPYHGRVTAVYTYAGRSGEAPLLQQRDGFQHVAVEHAGGTRTIRTSRVEHEAYESGELKYETQTLYQYDSYDNVTLESDLNDVSTAADDVYSLTAYINDTAQWRIGVVRTNRTCADAACGTVLQWAHNYYDDLPMGQVGARGEVTRSSAWRSDTNTWVGSNFTYDAAGSLLTRTNAAGTISQRNEYDAASGDLVRSTDALGHSVSNEYDEVTGELIAVTDPNGNTSSFGYDVLAARTAPRPRTTARRTR